MNNLRAEMTRSEQNIESFSKVLGISKQALSDKLNEKTDFKLTEVKKIFKFFKEKGSSFEFDYLFSSNVQ